MLFPQVTAAATESNDATLNQQMTAMGRAISNLFPLLIDSVPLDSMPSQKILEENIKSLVEIIPQVKSHFSQKSVTYQLSFDVIQNHMTGLQTALANKRLNHVKSMLLATTAICVSCHSQDSHTRTLFVGYGRDKFKSDFSFAEYNFITRNYEQAESFYLRYLNKPGKHNNEADQLTALRHLLNIYTQILNNPAKGLETFKKIKKIKFLSAYSRKKVQVWLNGLDEITKLNANKNELNFSQINSYTDKFILAENRPTHLEHLYWIRGMIYRYLGSAPKEDEIPTLLFWLALSERGDNQSVYFSLGDLYLKQCIVKYPNSPVAKKCFGEYKDAIEFSYSGSKGTDIPDDIQEDLNNLQALVYPDKAPID